MFKSKFLPVFTFLFIAVLASCNFNSRKTSSLYLDLSGIKAKVIGDKSDTERKLIDDYTDTDEQNIKPLFVDIEITEGFEFKETIDLHKQVTLEIAEVPVGTRVKAKIDVYTYTTYEYDGERQEFYFEEASKNILYSGESKPRVISGGPNSITILMKELTKKIYVRYADDFQEGNFIRNALENDSYETEDDEGNAITITNDGKTPSTGFFYIQSAIDWIAENGNPNYDYEIILTGYGDEVSFNQRFEFGNVNDDTDSLYGHAKSITFTSNNASVTAIKPDYPNTIIVSTVVPIIIKNIKISSCLTSNQNSTPNPLILSVGVEDISYYGNAYRPDVTLGYGTVFEGILNEENQIPARAAYGAIHVVNGDLTMEGNSTIYGFYGNGAKYPSNNYKYTAGAVFITSGSFKMTENSSISDCHASEGAYGGAIFSENNYNSVELGGNSQISECSAERGGAVYIQGGSLTIDGASITSCEATSYGGAIYIDATINEVNTYVKSGEIKDNSADYGSGIYLEGSSTFNNTSGLWSYSNAYLHLSDNAFIDPSNDIYLSNLEVTKLYLDSELTTDAETAALITLNSASADSTIINCANSNTSILENCFSKFCVNPTVDPQTDWYINENGVLKEVDYILKDNEYDENNNLIQEADPVQIGDLVFADNTRIRGEKYPYLTYELRNAPLAGIVFYAGTEDDLLGAVNLMVGTKTYNNNFTTLTKISNNGDTSFDLTQVENFPTYEIPATNNTVIIQKETSSTLPISEATFATGLSTGNTSLTEDIIDRILNGYSMNGNKYPLYQDIINYGALFSDSLYSTNLEENLTNNWYIPTIPEYTLFAQFLNNYSDLYKKLCGEIRTTYISATSVKGQSTYPQADTGNNVYHYAIDTENQIIKCVSTSGYYYYNSIPIHTYSLN